MHPTASPRGKGPCRSGRAYPGDGPGAPVLIQEGDEDDPRKGPVEPQREVVVGEGSA